MNLLVVKPSSLGDIVHALPAVQLLRRHYPEARIAWVVNREYVQLLELSPDIDDVIPFDRHSWGRPTHWKELLHFIRDLRRRKFDIAVDFQGLMRSSLIALASGCPRRVGFRAAREGASLLYTEKVLLPANLPHAVDKNIFLVRSAFAISQEVDFGGCFFQRDPETTAKVKQIQQRHGLTGQGPLLAVVPAARWASKAWPAPFFSRVMDGVKARFPTARWWIVGTGDEKNVGDTVCTGCALADPVNLMGELDLRMMVQMLRDSSVVLTNDTGPMHVAAALDVPTVAMFGPTNPELTGPYGPNHWVLKAKCDCAPCFNKDCPNEKRVCTDTVSPEDAIEAVLQAYQRTKKECENA